MTSIFGGGETVTKYVPMATPAPVINAPAPPAAVAAPVAPGPLPVPPTIAPPATAPLPQQVTAAGNQAAATIAQRAGRSSTVLTTRAPKGTAAGNYGSGASGASNSNSSGNAGSPYAAKTLG